MEVLFSRKMPGLTVGVAEAQDVVNPEDVSSDVDSEDVASEDQDSEDAEVDEDEKVEVV